MLSGYHPVLQSLMGTLLTWGLTALGASLVLVFQGGQVSLAVGTSLIHNTRDVSHVVLHTCTHLTPVMVVLLQFSAYVACMACSFSVSPPTVQYGVRLCVSMHAHTQPNTILNMCVWHKKDSKFILLSVAKDTWQQPGICFWSKALTGILCTVESTEHKWP